MTPLKPYLIRSIYEWIIDNDTTPHLLVDAENTTVQVPKEFVENGRIVLNMRPAAIQGLVLGDSIIEFNTRFSGKHVHINVPVVAVLALYAKENGRGMVFDAEDEDYNDSETEFPEENPSKSKPQLRIVK